MPNAVARGDRLGLRRDPRSCRLRRCCDYAWGSPTSSAGLQHDEHSEPERRALPVLLAVQCCRHGPVRCILHGTGARALRFLPERQLCLDGTVAGAYLGIQGGRTAVPPFAPAEVFWRLPRPKAGGTESGGSRRSRRQVPRWFTPSHVLRPSIGSGARQRLGDLL